MAQHSPVTTAFRAVVMLTCLITIPAVAICGKSLPERLKTLIERGWSHSAAALFDKPTERPTPYPSPQPVDWGDLPAGPPIENRPAVSAAAAGAMTAKLPASESPAAAGGALPGEAVLASYEMPLEESNRDGTLSGAEKPDVSRGGAAGMVPVRRPAGHRRDLLAPTGKRPEPIDRFTFVQQRLRQLGATYYLLESWGRQQQLYRFYCRVAIAGSPRYTRYFEATAARPLEAMDKVLAEVETWRGRP